VRAAFFFILIGTSACSFDWSTTPLADAATDASDAAAEASVPDAADCATLTTALSDARLAAKKCASGANVCTATTKDECGCTITLANASSPEDTAYAQALAAFQAAQCVPTCNACAAATPGLCEVGPNLVTYCLPL
jgi:hypothetical protein